MASQLLDLKGFLSFLILHELGKKALCGEDLAKKIGRRKGTDQLTPGTIYPALKTLRELKLVTFEQFGRKKVYSLTDEGKKELKQLHRQFSKYFAGMRSRIRSTKKKLKRKTRTSKQK